MVPKVRGRDTFGPMIRIGCAGWVGAVWLLLGCQAPESAPAESGARAPRWAQGFLWVRGGGAEWLEVREVPTEEVLARVFRDSAAYRAAGTPEKSVVLGPAARGLATLSTTHVALIGAWAPDYAPWTGGAALKFLQDPTAAQAVARGAVVDLGGPEIDKERLLALMPAAFTTYPFGDPLEGLGIEGYVPVVPVLEYLEPHPLGRAEWMRAFGWLCGPEAAARADSAFAAVERRYLALVVAPGDGPRVFTGSVHDGVWAAPGGNSLVARLIADAGATYVFADRLTSENVEVPFEEMVGIAAGTDAWGLISYAPEGLTRAGFLSEDPRHRLLVPPSGRLFGANAAECDYFGALVAQPDALLADLVALFHPERAPGNGAGCFRWLDAP